MNNYYAFMEKLNVFSSIYKDFAKKLEKTRGIFFKKMINISKEKDQNAIDILKNKINKNI